MLLTGTCLADSASFLQAERQLLQQEQALSRLADGLEEWLAGRLAKEQLLIKLEEVSQDLKECPGLPRDSSRKLLRLERTMLDKARSFATRNKPDGEGQRELFLSLSSLNEERTLLLLEWRTRQLTELLADSTPAELHAHYRWEASWLPLWREEAVLTRKLQQGLLNEGPDQADHRAILQSLLRLRSRAEAVAPPALDRELHRLCLERLVILARTAEQLLRLEKRKSRGALTRVRRLSKRLSALTEEYQEKRLHVLQQVR